jgi:hypothetical protein
MSYRPASANQLSGAVNEMENSYTKEHFGFLDGRKMTLFKSRFIHKPQSPADYIENVQQELYRNAVFVRDMVLNQENILVGPHAGGVNVLSRGFEVEYRDHETIQAQLKANGQAVKF